MLLLSMLCGNIYALQGSVGGNGCNAKAVHDLGIRGTGVKIGLIGSQNVFVEHNAFEDVNGIVHVLNINSDLTEGFWHDTIMAGIIISQGQAPNHVNDIGVAPGAMIYSFRLGSEKGSTLNIVLTELIENRNCKIILTGFEYEIDPNGQSQETLKYDYYADSYDVIFANAAGNTGSYITVLGDGYNGITTGGLAETQTDVYKKAGQATNDGPTSDFRRKPDIMAPSTNQVTPAYNSGDPDYWNPTGYSDGATSWAVPHTAGVAALLLQYANQTSEPHDENNVVIKAVMVNSSFPNINRRDNVPTYPANPANVWHPQRGYGRLDALKAFQTLSSEKISKDVLITSDTTKGWAYDVMNPYATHTYYISAKKDERLALTVTWNRKIDLKPGPVYEVNEPMFNIDMTVLNPSGGVLFNEIDDVNNLEKIDMILPVDGNYTVLLENTTCKQRAYGLAFEIFEPMAGDFNLDYIVNKKDLRQLALEWLNSGEGMETDINADDIVNIPDYGRFAEDWMKNDLRYYNP